MLELKLRFVLPVPFANSVTNAELPERVNALEVQNWPVGRDANTAAIDGLKRVSSTTDASSLLLGGPGHNRRNLAVRTGTRGGK